MSSAPMRAKLALHYGTFDLDVDVTLPATGVSALFGPSGSGKTTCLRALAGLAPGCTGRVEVDGQLWQDDATGVFLPAHRRPVGFVFQDARLFRHLTVRGNLQYAMRRAADGEPFAFDDVVQLLDLGALLERHPPTLSGGERQRCAIGRALLTQPRLLLLDEPLSALDEARKAELLPYLERVCEMLSIPMIYVSHAMREVARLADHLVLMERGRVVASGPIAEISARADLAGGDVEQAGAVIDGRCAAHDAEYALTQVGFDGGSLWIPAVACAVGHPLRVRIAANDVSLALERPRVTSILNVLPATVIGRHDAAATSLIELTIGNSRLLARVTRRSAASLGLAPGTPVYAQIKGAAVLR